jgi:hypothetical protein
VILKTSVQQQWNIVQPPHYIVYTQATVDNVVWYTVKCSRDASAWVREQDTEGWHEHIDQRWYSEASTFDINQELLVILKLRWGA